MLWALWIGSFRCYAVETIIVGEVVNETTGEAVPNVNIRFRGTKIGTTSDENGNYVLRVDMQAKEQLIFSAVGYYTQRFDIEPGAMAGLQVALRERTATLSEVVVSPAENPAIGILRQVRAHREENDRTLHKESSIVAQREQTLYISHISKRHLQRALWKSLQAGMIAQEDSTYILPLYREKQSFRLSGTEMIPANDKMSQTLILTETSYASLLGGEGNLNFYAPSVSIMGHAFLSPIAAGGNLYYRYYIVEEDSLSAPMVRIAFRTRNPFYATFNGEMVIDTSAFALRSIQAHVPAEVAVNYVNTLHVHQTLAPDGTIAEEKISVLLDFSIKTEKAGTVFPTLLLTTNLNNPQNPTQPPHKGGALTTSPSLVRRDEEGFSSADSAFATLENLPIIRTAQWFATIATTGYIPTGTMVDIGHIEEILQINKHEGLHLGLPFRTNEKLSDVVSLEASVGYGFKDRSVKGMGRVSVNLPTTRKSTLQVEYQDHYVWSEVDDFGRLLRENSMGWGNFDFTAYAFEALHRDTLCRNTAMRQRQIQAYWFADWTPNFETRAYVRAGWQPAELPLYTANATQPTPNIAYQSLSLIGRLSWGERKYDGYFMRRYAYSSRYPVLYIGFETGHWAGTASQPFEKGAGLGSNIYAHIRLMLSQHANLGMGGTLSYALQGGAIFGHVPATMLWQANGNQGFAYDPYRYTFLHGGELTADKYVALQTEWNGQGILFNMIPGIRWLHLRELVEAKVAYGYNSTADKHKTYAEVGIGLGNILRVCDLYSVWGFTQNDRLVNGKRFSPQWGMRFRIHLGL